MSIPEKINKRCTTSTLALLVTGGCMLKVLWSILDTQASLVGSIYRDSRLYITRQEIH